MRLLLIGLTAAALLVGLSAVSADDSTPDSITMGSSGPQIFKKNGCTQCHTVKSAGIKHTGEVDPENPPHDLKNITIKDTATLGKFLHKKHKLHGKKHRKKFKGSDEDLATLTAWLVKL